MLLYPLLALLIELEDGGPIIYRRKVVGEGGAQFDAFKFRSMRVNADEVLNSICESRWGRKSFQMNSLRLDGR